MKKCKSPVWIFLFPLIAVLIVWIKTVIDERAAAAREDEKLPWETNYRICNEEEVAIYELGLPGQMWLTCVQPKISRAGE